ncbi:Imm52 family immunity protein [Stenotrophomonas sp. 24(2023)]|uniref:Imm52 family immunity protein n=1 Tax=Stenotrophomonas sp. 24(2023) TaxID=3068324 RepID=UPI0027DF18D9|nr:Imm52 family immunity protein [Stenotrophomonas sp. 24(2023)]WMJ68913.1 Imm52 family immunity protein [Stenotrophomonas sp. 24(2023)]
MISTYIRIDITKQVKTDFQASYRQLRETLRRIPGNHLWFCGVNAPGQQPVRFEQEDIALPRLRKRSELLGSTSFGAYVSSDNATRRFPGLIEIDYNPECSYMTISVYRPDEVKANPTPIVSDILLAVLEGEPGITFAFADVYDKVDGAFKYYRTAHATFPHRKCLGWMAYVPETVTHEQLPLAAAILPAPGGSIIVSIDEAFNLADTHHIQRANQIEMDMSDLELLPVIDPTF